MKSFSSRSLARVFVGPYLLPAAVLGALATFCLAKAVSLGVCCADDAYFASVAKNLAFGLGYGTTATGDGFVLFDMGITTGPAVILPAAGAIALFGHRPWVPGAVAVALWCTLATLVFRAARKAATDVSPGGLRDASLLFLLGIPLLFPFHFETWSNLLGEAPAALFLLLGFALLAAEELSIRTVCLASLACSLAVLSKIVTLPGYVALVVGLAVRLAIVERRGIRVTATHLLASGLAFIGPLLLFEAAKVVSFGNLRLYGEHVARKLSFIGGQGLPSIARPGLLSRMVTHDGDVAGRFGLSVIQSLIGVACAFAVILRSGRQSLVRMAIPIVLTVAMTAGWFLFLSNGWPRSYLIAMILVGGLVAVAVASMESRTRLPAALAVLAILLSVNHGKLPYLAHGMENGWFRPSDELESAMAVTNMIDEALDDPEEGPVFVTQWWGATVDIEYYSRHANIFESHTRLGDRDAFTVVYNRRFAALQDEGFQRVLGACRSHGDDSASHVVMHSKAGDLPDSRVRMAERPAVSSGKIPASRRR
jgi:hypothetical protein